MLPADHGRAAADEELRHLARIQIVAHRERMLGADRVEDGEHTFLLHELLRELDGLDGVVLVVLDFEDDFAAVYATMRIDVVEIRGRTGQRRRIRRLRTAERAGCAEHYLGCRDPGCRCSGGGNGEDNNAVAASAQLHRETACFRTDTFSVTRPIVISAPGWTAER